MDYVGAVLIALLSAVVCGTLAAMLAVCFFPFLGAIHERKQPQTNAMIFGAFLGGASVGLLSSLAARYTHHVPWWVFY